MSTKSPDRFTPPVSCAFGAPMGRPGVRTIDEAAYRADPTLIATEIPLDEGGYDSGGAYWGLGGCEEAPTFIYAVHNASESFHFFVRATDGAAAEAIAQRIIEATLMIEGA